MSHGPAGGGHGQQSAEPNLTPLLDLVLQLVMFFMLVANFVMDEQSDKVRLPVASQAKPLTTKDTNITYLNVDKTGRVLVPLRAPLLSPEEIKFHMLQLARSHPSGEAKAKEEMTVIIRADKDARYHHILKTMQAIKAAGFRKLQLRAQIAESK
jgi:biopolymer transport protein ExbD